MDHIEQIKQARNDKADAELMVGIRQALGAYRMGYPTIAKQCLVHSARRAENTRQR